MAGVRGTIFPDYILEMYPDLNTEDYYDFSYNLTKAVEILDAAGYPPLGFTDESDNRFGFGFYANETFIDGVNRNIGRHFKILTWDTPVSVVRAVEVKKALRQIGIYVDLIIAPYAEFYAAMWCTPGWMYNQTAPQLDPAYQGANWDFLLGGVATWYDTPINFIGTWASSFAYWYFLGYAYLGWFNEEFEIGLAKALGGKPFLGSIPFPSDMPADGYPTPEWVNEDSQFIEGCSRAGKALSNELPSIPVVWYYNFLVSNAHIQNLVFDHNLCFYVAYAFWE